MSSGASVVSAPAYVPVPRLDDFGAIGSELDAGLLRLPLGDGLLGRVVDSHGKPIDRMGPLASVRDEPMARRPINSMDRDPVRTPLDTGVRAINAMLTVGRGQRLGLFAGTGVGKSVLLGMMARFTSAEVVVVGLIGERGREVKEFIEEILGPMVDRFAGLKIVLGLLLAVLLTSQIIARGYLRSVVFFTFSGRRRSTRVRSSSQ